MTLELSSPLLLSLRVAFFATLLIVVFGLPICLLLARVRFPGRDLLGALLALPLVLPPTVLGFALLAVFGRRGPVGSLLEGAFGVAIVFHESGAVLAAAVAAFPLFFLPARSALAGVDQRLEDAARLLGRGEWSVLRHVTLPLAWKGLMAGTLLAFTRALGDFGATLMLAGNIPGRTQTAPLALYDAVNAGDPARAWRISAWLVSIALVVAWFGQRGLERRTH